MDREQGEAQVGEGGEETAQGVVDHTKHAYIQMRTRTHSLTRSLAYKTTPHTHTHTYAHQFPSHRLAEWIANEEKRKQEKEEKKRRKAELVMRGPLHKFDHHKLGAEGREVSRTVEDAVTAGVCVCLCVCMSVGVGAWVYVTCGCMCARVHVGVGGWLGGWVCRQS